MNTSNRRLAAISILAATTLTVTACGSSNDDTAVPAADTTPTTIVTGDPAIDNAINTGAAEAALLAMDDQSTQLPDDAQSTYDQLNTDLEDAKNATGSDAEAAWAKVNADVTAIDDQISHSASDVDSTATNAWTDVKNEFDKITAKF